MPHHYLKKRKPISQLLLFLMKRLITTTGRHCFMPVNNLADFALKLYPNPTNGLVNLQYTLPDKAKGKILLFSIDGKQVGTFDLDKGTNPTVLDISYLPNGLYLYKMTINDKHEASGRVSVMN